MWRTTAGIGLTGVALQVMATITLSVWPARLTTSTSFARREPATRLTTGARRIALIAIFCLDCQRHRSRALTRRSNKGAALLRLLTTGFGRSGARRCLTGCPLLEAAADWTCSHRVLQLMTLTGHWVREICCDAQ